MGWGVTTFASWGGGTPAVRFVPSPERHANRAADRLIAQYAMLPKMVGLMKALSAPWQLLEDAVYTVLQVRSLDDGFGGVLDGFGDLIELDRGGAEDNTFRVWLRAKILANGADGSPEAARAVLDKLMGGINPVRIIDGSPGSIVLRTYELLQADGDIFARIVAFAAPIGRRVIVEWELPARLGPAFGWENDNSSTTWAEWGADPSGAGLWAEAFDGGGTP